MDNYTAKILLREDYKKKDGTRPIILRLTINRKPKKYSLNLSTKEDNWDTESSRIRRNDPLKFKNNNLIEKAEKRARDIIYDYKDNHKKLTFTEFEKHFFDIDGGGKVNNDSFYDFAAKEIDLLYRSSGSKETKRTQTSMISKLKKYYGDSLNFCEIDLKFLESYREYMINDLKNTHNTWVRSFSFFKSIINKAIKKGLVKENVFKNFSFSYKEGNREGLTSLELESLESMLKDSNILKSHKRALIPFIFSCYTGLRYSDIYNLKYKDIKSVQISGKEWRVIKMTMHKTKDIVEIPLAPKVRDLIPETGFNEQKVFRVYTNQAQNRYLKEIAKKKELNIHLSFHCARHTFATILLNLEVPITVISKLLGHTNLKTTQIYAKVQPESKVKAIDKLNGMF